MIKAVGVVHEETDQEGANESDAASSEEGKSETAETPEG